MPQTTLAEYVNELDKDACVETLGLRSENIVVEFTQHSHDEMYRPGRGWGTEWTPAEAELKT